MAEGERESKSGEGDFLWRNLPRDLQHKVLTCLPLHSLFQARAVCRDWRSVVHRREFAALYDAAHQSTPPHPTICYTISSATHVEWARFDYAAAAWKKMTRLACRSRDGGGTNPSTTREDCGVYPVGGLLCFHHKKAWVVWNPLTSRWKHLPPYRNESATTFVCAFESCNTPSYKILMAHYEPGRLVTEVYDSATGAWTERARQLRMVPFLTTRGGVVGRNGVIYFRSSRNAPGFGMERVLLCYDIHSEEWREEVSDRRCTRLFDWDGRVMTVMLEEERFAVFEWDFGSRKWADTGLEIPMQVKRKFDYSVSMSTALLEMVAARAFLVVAGYARDGSFRTALYDDDDANWRCGAGGLRFARSATCRLNGMVLFKPRLDWVP